jgi:hypothetical protein
MAGAPQCAIMPVFAATCKRYVVKKCATQALRKPQVAKGKVTSELPNQRTIDLSAGTVLAVKLKSSRVRTSVF